jgi:hypothetical protein
MALRGQFWLSDGALRSLHVLYRSVDNPAMALSRLLVPVAVVQLAAGVKAAATRDLERGATTLSVGGPPALRRLWAGP